MEPDELHPGHTAPRGRTLVCSYVPLLGGRCDRRPVTRGRVIRRLLAEAARCPSGQASALLWLADSGGVLPVFVLDEADAIADHLLDWCGGAVGDWFALCLGDRGPRAVAVLVPNLTRPIGQFEAAAADRMKTDGFELLVRPLFFVSRRSHAFGLVGRAVTSSTRVGLLDATAFASAHPPSLALTRIRTVGPVGMWRDERPFGFDAGPLIDRLVVWSVGADGD